MISTKGRYALRVMIDLAQQGSDTFTPLKDIAGRQAISEKYLEIILKVLVKEKLLKELRGKGGGYKLCREPEDYSVGDILRAAGEDLAPVSCLSCNAPVCSRAAECRTLPMWKKFCEITNSYFDGITLADLMNTDSCNDYVI